MCFEILGFDILVDEKLKPWLLEINYTPSFSCGSELDTIIKQGVISSALTLTNVSLQEKYKCLQNQKRNFQKRMVNGKKNRLSCDQRRKLIDKE